ncbi:MAG: rhomboid family intramembrane serine protease [Planctomycetota bacterium]
MLFFPLGTDRKLRATPWVNYALIATNVVVFLFTERATKQLDAVLRLYYEQLQSGVADRQDLLAFREDHPVFQAWLQPEFPQLLQFFTYQFLHADLFHLLGNMLFLYVFGNAVEDRLGKLGYLAFYLGGGVMAGLAHITFSDAPVLGASGSVAAVTGAFLALFPLANITIFYWFVFIIDSFRVSAIVLILFRVAQDFIFNLAGIGNVAYMAHLAGYAYGFSAGMAILLLRLVPGEPCDMVHWIQHKRRRHAARSLDKSGYTPWETPKPARGEAPPKVGDAGDITPEQQAIMQRRSTISKLIATHDLAGASDAYAALLDEYPAQVLPQAQQLDVANQLMADRKHAVAARAYELFLDKHRTYPDKPQIQLILGLIYARYLTQPDRARELLTSAADRLEDNQQLLAQQALDELSGKSKH